VAVDPGSFNAPNPNKNASTARSNRFSSSTPAPVRAAAFDAFRQQLDAFGELRMEPDDVIAEDDRVVVRMTVSGRHTGTH
jgi:predicted ester cyclase